MLMCVRCNFIKNKAQNMDIFKQKKKEYFVSYGGSVSKAELTTVINVWYVFYLNKEHLLYVYRAVCWAQKSSLKGWESVSRASLVEQLVCKLVGLLTLDMLNYFRK